jgi:hypothetical protein
MNAKKIIFVCAALCLCAFTALADEISFTRAGQYNPDLPIWGFRQNGAREPLTRNLFSASCFVDKPNQKAVLSSAKVEGGAFTANITLSGRQKEGVEWIRVPITLKLETSAAGDYNYLTSLYMAVPGGQTTDRQWDGTENTAGYLAAFLQGLITENGLMYKTSSLYKENPGVRVYSEKDEITPEDEFQVALTKSGDGAVINKYTGDRQYVNIPEEIQGFPVREIAEESFIGGDVGYYSWSARKENNNIKSIAIPEGVVSIGKQAFAGCQMLTTVSIPDSVTSIGESAFSGCNALSSITMPASITSIGRGAFSGTALTSVTWPEGFTSIGSSTFESCQSLASITIPASVTSIGEYAFRFSGLTSLAIPAGVKSIRGEAFRSCKALTSVTIPDSAINFDSRTFEECENLVTVSISPIKRSWGSSSFSKCPKLSLASQAALKAAGYTDNM